MANEQHILNQIKVKTLQDYANAMKTQPTGIVQLNFDRMVALLFSKNRSKEDQFKITRALDICADELYNRTKVRH